MPREEAYFTYGYPKMGHGRSHITAEEAAGIGILIVILGILLLIGCWYCRRRSGYKSLKDREYFSLFFVPRARCLAHGSHPIDKSIYVSTQSTLTGRCPREGLGHQDSKLPFQENSCDPVVPNAPPAYEKLSATQSPPPYSP
ncbi:melanoma antigen recognized by T-cells 1 isoform X1 [Equus przewalskii]|uniref:Melanoma antigen recognized by T-cells 1 isoform X1 n=1 Tax=Equus przewalskii TaxID=9798 RepID=A0ABM4M0D7_EQUPR